jgi:hypothetical protein
MLSGLASRTYRHLLLAQVIALVRRGSQLSRSAWHTTSPDRAIV